MAAYLEREILGPRRRRGLIFFYLVGNVWLFGLDAGLESLEEGSASVD